MDNYSEIHEEQKQVFQKTNWGVCGWGGAGDEYSMGNNVSKVVFMEIPINFQVSSNLTFNNTEYARKHLLLMQSPLLLYLLHEVSTTVAFILRVPV